MNRVKVPFAGALMAIAAACSASGIAETNPGPDGTREPSVVDAGPSDDASHDVDLDAERPLICGDAGFCETRLPRSDLGVPLSMQGVWAVASNDVWGVTAEGYVLRYDGATWKTDYRVHHGLSTVWATPSAVWVGGEAGIVLRRDAAGQWSTVETGHTSRIRSISGTGDGDVWLASDDGLVDHFDGAALTSYETGIDGLRITSVFRRPGQGMYAAGYVKGPPATPVGWELPNVHPYIVELLPAGAIALNPAFSAQKGFVPVAAAITDAPNDSQVIFVLGHVFHFSSSDLNLGYTLEATYGTLGMADGATLATILVNQDDHVQRREPSLDAPPRYGMWVNRWDDIRMPFAYPAIGFHLCQWDGTSQKEGSIAMGNRFPPRAITDVHGTATDMWIVGDGFAIQGAPR